MLDSVTKRRIDGARDILVGKVPDPKAQVEQITTALIYKFMDDMDRQAIELGGTATFFSGDFEKYAWPKVMDRALSGYERMKLYDEAITGMGQNPNLPGLFIEIFKGAFLPYRAPKTLNLFLKQINEFTYDHSEKMGDAFEELLSIMGAQGAAGQFRTPRHIIDFIVQAVDPGKNDRILDPACGTAGFLISAYKHILSKHQGKKSLSPDEMKKLMENISGYDISPEMVRLSLVNMYLHQFPNPKVYEYDTLTSKARWEETFDVILANPPFMTPKGGIRPHQRFAMQANRSEVLFVDYIMEHLSPDGRAGVIVPEGIIFKNQNAYKKLRKMLVEENYLYAVVSLPAGVFNPYAGVKTSILLMDRKIAKQTDKILFVNIENDGFNLGAQRQPIKENDLPKALNIIRKFHKKEKQNKKDCEIAHLVEKKAITKDGEYNLSAGRYINPSDFSNVQWPLVELGEVCEFVRGPFGGSLKKEIFVENGYAVYEQQHAIHGNFDDFRYFITEEKFKEMRRFEVFAGDILMSCSGTFGRVSIVPEIKPQGIINQALLKLSVNEKLSNKYLALIMQEINFQNQLSNGTTGGVIKNVSSVKVLKKLKIPLPPIDVQQEIVEEIEGYQKEINEKYKDIDTLEKIIEERARKVWGE